MINDLDLVMFLRVHFLTTFEVELFIFSMRAPCQHFTPRIRHSLSFVT